jgi:hypothetical protein
MRIIGDESASARRNSGRALSLSKTASAASAVGLCDGKPSAV